MTTRTFKEVAKESETLFNGFLKGFSNVPLVEKYFVSGPELSRGALIVFFRHVAKERISKGVQNAMIAESRIPLDVTNVPGGKPVQAPSWLARDDKDPKAPVIALDVQYISTKLPKNAPLSATLIAKLILHEIGHVALHWNDLYPKVRDQMYVNSASSSQEQEAWWFAGVVWAKILGKVAPSGRPGVIDDIWYRA